MAADSTSPTHSDASDSDSPCTIAYVLLFITSPCRVLTYERDGIPHLPSFEYSQKDSYNPQLCCNDLAQLLDLRPERNAFRTVAELSPRDDDSCSGMYNPKGLVHLLLVEPLSSTHFSYATSATLKWTTAQDFYELLCSEDHFFDYQFAYHNLRLLMESCAGATKASSTFICHHAWILRAATYLQTVVRDLKHTPTSEVERQAWMSTALLFKINTTNGWYYMKSQSTGCAEASITECVAQLFPDDTLELVAVNPSLDCFVAREFRQLTDIDTKDERIIARKLARIQLQSLKHLDRLKETGCPDFSPSALVIESKKWVAGPIFRGWIQNVGYSTENFSDTVQRLCDELDTGAIPMTLVHGDLGRQNYGYRDDLSLDGGIIFFDWQTASISHPFCDLRKTNMQSKVATDEYLGAWRNYVDLREARLLLKLGKKVGCVIDIASNMKRATATAQMTRKDVEFPVRSCLQEFLDPDR